MKEFFVIFLFILALLFGCKSKPKDVVFLDSSIVQQSESDFYDMLNERNIFTSVEQMPQFPGRETALMKYLADSLTYPKIPEGDEITPTRCIARFYIDADGTVKGVKIVRSMHPAVDSALIRVIENMPKWEPGKQNDIAVPVYYTLPVHIDLRR